MGLRRYQRPPIPDVTAARRPLSGFVLHQERRCWSAQRMSWAFVARQVLTVFTLRFSSAAISVGCFPEPISWRTCHSLLDSFSCGAPGTSSSIYDASRSAAGRPALRDRAWKCPESPRSAALFERPRDRLPTRSVSCQACHPLSLERLLIKEDRTVIHPPRCRPALS